MNLKEETVEFLIDCGKTLKDVAFVTDGTYQTDIFQFLEDADFDYDNEDYSHSINNKLTIIGEGWWMVRIIIFGDECWSYRTMPEFDQPLKNGILEIKRGINL